MNVVLKNDHNIDISTMMDEMDHLLLQHWLLSLMICDVSLITTISRLDNDDDSTIRLRDI